MTKTKSKGILNFLPFERLPLYVKQFAIVRVAASIERATPTKIISNKFIKNLDVII